jgi:hypothetical protein
METGEIVIFLIRGLTFFSAVYGILWCLKKLKALLHRMDEKRWQRIEETREADRLGRLP